MPYKLLENVAIADIAFEATGRDLSELFQSAAQAFIEISANPKTVGDQQQKQLSLSAGTVDRLLFDFLGELIYLKDAKFMVFSRCKVAVRQEGGKWLLTATLWGEGIDEETQELRNDVKAVTQHMFEVTQLPDGWKATVVLDI